MERNVWSSNKDEKRRLLGRATNRVQTRFHTLGRYPNFGQWRIAGETFKKCVVPRLRLPCCVVSKPFPSTDVVYASLRHSVSGTALYLELFKRNTHARFWRKCPMRVLQSALPFCCTILRNGWKRKDWYLAQSLMSPLLRLVGFVALGPVVRPKDQDERAWKRKTAHFVVGQEMMRKRRSGRGHVLQRHVHTGLLP